MGDYWFWTEVTSGIFIKIQKILTPYLYESLTIFWSVSWVYCMYDSLGKYKWGSNILLAYSIYMEDC